MADRVYKRKLKDLIPDPHNLNAGTVRGLAMLEDSIRDYGIGRGVLLDRNNGIIGGNKTVERLIDLGFEDVLIVPTDGKTLVATQRIDLDLSDPKARALGAADNRVSEVDLSWNPTVLQSLLDDGMDLSKLFDNDELATLLVTAQESEPPVDFASYDENIETQYCCPKCGYKWSGKPDAEA